MTFRWTHVFASDGAVISSDSTLRFRERDEVAQSLEESGYVVDEVRDAPTRPRVRFRSLACLLSLLPEGDFTTTKRDGVT